LSPYISFPNKLAAAPPTARQVIFSWL